MAILSDEIYSHLIFEGAEFTSFLTFPELRDRTIMLDGWSKTFAMTGWRLGFGIWPRGLVEHVKKLITVDHSCTNVATQMAGLAAITGPMDEIERFRQSFEQRRKHRGRRAQCHAGRLLPDAGRRLLCLSQHEGHRPRFGRAGRELLEEAHVALVPGESFGGNGEGYLRLSYAASEADIREALRRMDAFLG